MLHTFSCTTYIHIQRKERDGLQPKSKKCIYLSFEDSYKGWCCLDPLTKCTIVSHDVIFDELDFPGLSITVSTSKPDIPLPTLFPIEASAVPNVQPPPDPAPLKLIPALTFYPPWTSSWPGSSASRPPCSAWAGAPTHPCNPIMTLQPAHNLPG